MHTCNCGLRLFLRLPLQQHQTSHGVRTTQGVRHHSKGFNLLNLTGKHDFPAVQHAKPSLQKSSPKSCRKHIRKDMVSHARWLQTTQVTLTTSNLHLCLLCSQSEPTDMNKHRCSAPIFLHGCRHVLMPYTCVHRICVGPVRCRGNKI